MLLIKGKIVGIRTKQNVNRQTGEVKDSMYVGFSSPRKNGYAGQEDITEVRITEKQMSVGLQALYEKLVGKDVTAPVFAMAWTNGKGMTYFFENEGKPLSQ